MAFSGEKEQHEKGPLPSVSPKLLLWQCQGVCQAVCQTALLELLTLSPTNVSPVRTDRKHAAYLLHSSFPACCLHMGQNYWSHLEILWLYIWRGKSGGSFHLIPSEKFMNYYCFSIQGFQMWGFFLEYYEPNSEPLQTEVLPKVTSTDWKMFTTHQEQCRVRPRPVWQAEQWPNFCHSKPWARKPTGQGQMHKLR